MSPPLHTTVPRLPLHQLGRDTLSCSKRRRLGSTTSAADKVTNDYSEEGSIRSGNEAAMNGPSYDGPRTLAQSLAELDASSQAYRLQQTGDAQKEKQTGSKYETVVRQYQAWWLSREADLSASDPERIEVPALPITAAKVATFLQHESTREKYKSGKGGETIPGSSLGHYAISGIISALEKWRFDRQHVYRDDHDAQVSLRQDNRIRAFEQAAKANEPERIKKAQKLKATGTSTDAYTLEELSRCSSWCLTNPKGPRQITIGLRDRAMILLGAATAFRGDSARMLWSDLYVHMVPIIEQGLGKTVLALAALADNAKTNQSGKVNEHGALRHRLVELCPVGAVGFNLFADFHILNIPVPDFTPDFSNSQYGEWGYRAWLDYHVFHAKSLEAEMSYENHRERVGCIHKACDVELSKVTHATRHFAAINTRAHNSTRAETKALGNWSEPGSYGCYDRLLPKGALLAAATFDASKPESYNIPRGMLEPPPELLTAIFPFVEREQAALKARSEANSYARDFSLANFLQLLVWLRRVILQDAAVLFTRHPHCPFFNYAPFNSPLFRSFAQTSDSLITQAELTAELNLRNLPEHLVQSVRGIVANVTLAQEHHHKEMEQWKDQVSGALTQFEGKLDTLLGSKHSRKRKRQETQSAIFTAPPPTPVTSHPMAPAPPAFANSLNVPSISSTSVPPPTFASLMSAPPISHPPPGFTAPASLSINQLPSSLALPSQSLIPSEAQAQAKEWAALVAKFGEARLHKHHWEWTEDSWLPFYRYQSGLTITGVWREYYEGVGGHLSVRELEDTWKKRWRRNVAGQRQEANRRGKIVGLIQDHLAKKPRWDTQLAVRFLKDKYEDNKGWSARTLSDRLTASKDETIAEAMALASNYP